MRMAQDLYVSTKNKKLMKNSTFKKAVLALSIAVLAGGSAQALTYTAVASGNFNSSATWQGGLVPPSTLLADVIVIPTGITVTLDVNQQINGTLSTLNIDGALNSSVSAGNSLVLTAGSITGGGNIDIDSLVLGLTTGFSFSGTINADDFVSLGSTISSNATVMVDDMLELRNSILTLGSGTLSLGTGATIVVSGGTMTTSGGTLSLTNNYNVVYRNNSATTGIELMGSGLTNVEIDVPSSSTITLNNDLNLKGMLTLTSGTLNTNNNDLFFTGAADIAATGSGWISSTNGTNITFTSNGNTTGGLRFSSTGNTVNNLTINLSDNSKSIKLGTDLEVEGALSLQAGRLDIDNNDLVVRGSLTGGSANSFVVTGDDGHLMLSVGAGASSMFHVGTRDNYAPAAIEGLNGSTTGMIGVNVHKGVYAGGTINTGANLATNQPLVNATWHLAASNTASINVNVQTMWSSDMEVNGMARSKVYLSNHTGGAWSNNGTSAATTEPNGMYAAKRNNVVSDGAFAVFGEDANTTSINTVAIKEQVFVYPNPAQNVLNFNGAYNKARIYNLNGNLVSTTNVVNNSVEVDQLPAGNYTIFLQGQDCSATTQFIKQ